MPDFESPTQAAPRHNDQVVVVAINGFPAAEQDPLRVAAERVLLSRGLRADVRIDDAGMAGIHVVSEKFARNQLVTTERRIRTFAQQSVYLVVGAGDDVLAGMTDLDVFKLDGSLRHDQLEANLIAALSLLRARSNMEDEFAERTATLVLANDEWQALLVSHSSLEDQLKHQNALFGAMFDTVVDGIVTIDERGRIELFNPAAQRVFGYAPDEVIGRNVAVLMRPADGAAHDGHLHRYLTTAEAKIIGVGGREVVCRRKDGSTFDAELSVAEARVGDVRRFTGIVRDISQRKALQRELAESQARLARQNAALVSLGTRKDTDNETLRDALTVICGVCRVALDIDLVRVWLVDRQQECLYVAAGWPDYAAEPRFLSMDCVNGLFDELEAEGVVIIDGGADGDPSARLINSDGATGKASLLAPVRSKNGIVGVMHCAADGIRGWMLDERNFIGFLADQVALSLEQDQTVRAKWEVRDRERRLAQAQQIARLGDWQWYPARDEFTGSDEFYRLVGRSPPAGRWTLAEYISTVHPEHRERVALEIERCVQHDTPVDGDFSVLRSDGSVRYVYGQVVAVPADLPTQRCIKGTLLDITERKLAEQAVIDMRDTLQEKVDEQTKDLIVARDEALAAERTMSAFLANMSHEIRTPLHAILSYARFGLKKTVAENQHEVNGYFDEIEDSGEDLLALLNDLLDLSKLKAGKMVYEPVPVNLKELADKVVAQFGPAAQEKKISLMVVGVDPRLVIQADKTKLTQVLRNLLSNAIKFSPEGEMVRITAKPTQDQHVVIAVTDQGPGVPPDELQGIFDPFVQSSKTKSKTGGTGLGLAICREIIENGHRGRIYVENNAGGGASFYVVLRPNT